MSGRKTHGNNSKRFDVNSFYAYVKKAHIEELLDKDGNTPYDSDSITNSVWEYAAYLYKDIQDYGGILHYFDSETFRADSDGSGNNTWTAISRTDAVTQVYKPLRRWLYSLDSEEGINNTMDLITSGFNRRYYTLPLSDSEGTLRHVNVYTFLKSHFDRWLRFDPYERRKITSRMIDNLNEDSDVRYNFANEIMEAIEEDSDLQRRMVEVVSNVLQTDSEVRNEILKTTITAFENDSDRARELVEIISNVLDTDSEIRNEFGDHFLTSIRNDSDQQTILMNILGDVNFNELNTDIIYARQVLPYDSDDTGNIGDSDQRWALGNFTTVQSDTVKVRSLHKDSIVFASDSDGTLTTSENLRWDGTNLIVNGITILPIDSEKFRQLLIENIDSEFDFLIDSDIVESIISKTSNVSVNAFPVGQRGNIYYIDSDNTNTLVNGPIVTVGTNRQNYFITSNELSEALSRFREHEKNDIIWDLDAQSPEIGGTAYVLDSDGAGNKSWTIDSDMSLNSGINPGRIIHNPNTKKTFYNSGSQIHEIGTARSFSDVIVMERLASPPDSDELGREGLRPGTIAVADGTNWDPKSLGGSDPYPVFWNGSSWLKFDLS